MGKPLLLMMLGHPGSGKSYFAKQLAPIMHAVRLNGDHMRTAMFDGDMDEIRNRDNNPKVFRAVDYAVEQILKAGHNVIYDAQHNFRRERVKGEQMAKQAGGEAVLVWVKASFDVALKRGMEREEAPDQRRKTDEQMRESLKFHIGNLEEPGPGEKVIVIDGTVSFAEQQRSFNEQLERLGL